MYARIYFVAFIFIIILYLVESWPLEWQHLFISNKQKDVSTPDANSLQAGLVSAQRNNTQATHKSTSGCQLIIIYIG